MKSLSGLSRGELLTLKFNNDLTDNPKTFELKIYSNKTLFEMKQQLALLIKAQLQSIKLSRNNLFNQSKELLETDNGKTLTELRLRQQLITISKKQSEPIAPVPLLTAEA